MMRAENRRVFLAVQFADGTGALMTRDEFLAHDWLARPAVRSKLVGFDDGEPIPQSMEDVR